MDALKISYDAVGQFRKMLEILEILPGKKDLVKSQGEKYSFLNEHYGFQVIKENEKDMRVVVGNPKTIFRDFVRNQMEKYKEAGKDLPSSPERRFGRKVCYARKK